MTVLYSPLETVLSNSCRKACLYRSYSLKLKPNLPIFHSRRTLIGTWSITRLLKDSQLPSR